MSESSPNPRWDRLTALARDAEANAGETQAPFGFAARVVAQAFARRREQALLLWQRWSWRAALFSATAAVACAFVAIRREGPPRLEVPAPTLEVPSLDWP